MFIASVPNLIGLDSLLYNNVNEVSNSGQAINNLLSSVCICETRGFDCALDLHTTVNILLRLAVSVAAVRARAISVLSPLAIYCEEIGQGYMSRLRVIHRRDV